ncbi:hypothetical protein PNA2_1236 [Pyrococcus sp. NA2]|uniref:Nif3-like dinuclear metal center hexameric protein n=1 Tax=Pyrococcus sp. (strain NA2) TaxID=342949 RepID=UPI000209AC62|nr:Nif3-like dinuclear metal center hexameric protein [Pyrococcus sp. NA2]AEC52151.1 hypothetical protein PNA2_1236 [Pyrococcus sp. NA2]
MKRDELVSFLDEFLNISSYPDKSSNGLQVEGKEEVETVGFAVDASLDVIWKARSLGVDLLVVHHGIIWGNVSHIRGLLARRLREIIKADINLYAAHIPLDAHPEVGNNAQLLKLLGLEPKEPFGKYKGVKIGFIGEFAESKPLPLIAQILAEKLPVDYVKSYEFGLQEVKRIAAVSGRGGFAIEEASEEADLLITGEITHEDYRTAEDLRVSIIAAGHYATETLGVKALMRVVKREFDVKTVFIDSPTGL